MIDYLFNLGLRWDAIASLVLIALGIGISIFNLWNNNRDL